jgi:rod shape-determining protein MreD
MIRTFLMVASILLAIWLQLSLFGHLRPLGVIPDLTLITIIVVALWSDATPSLAAAVGAGFILDLASGSDFGLRTGFFILVTLAVIAAKQFGLHADSVVTAALIALAATVLFNLSVLASLGSADTDWVVVGQRIGAEVIVNLGALVLVFAIRVLIGDRRGRVINELSRRSWQ